MIPRRLFVQLALLPLAAGSAAADVSLFVGEPGGIGDVWILSDQPAAPLDLPPELQGIRLLDFDVTGRTPLTELLPTSPRLRTDVPSASRVTLPSIQSALYRYRRDLPDGSARFGFFRIDSAGRAQPLGELAGGGVAGQVDPLAGRLSLSPSSDAVLLATKPPAGGDLYELDLTNGECTLRTANLPPQRFRLDGLCLLDTWGAALTDSGLVRFDRQPAVQAALVPFSGSGSAPAWFGAEIVCSADQSTIAFAAGDSPTAAYVHIVHATGDAVRASTQPQEVVGAGFLPASGAGPHMALSSDGGRVAWVSADPSGYSRECFACETPVQTTRPEIQLTADANFQDTLNDSGVISFLSPDELIFVVGAGDDSEIERADVFHVDFSGSTPVYTNLTATLGSTQTPFDYGTLETEDGILQIPGSSSLVMLDRGYHTSHGRLLRLDPTSGVLTTVLEKVRRIEWSEGLAASGVLLNVRRSTYHREHNLLEIGPTSSTLVLAAAPEHDLSRSAVQPGTGMLAAVLQNDQGGEFLGRLRPGGQGSLLSDMPLVFGPTVSVQWDGDIIASIPTPNGAVFMRWPEGRIPAPIWPAELTGFVLSGN